jgi:hypothetical protein
MPRVAVAAVVPSGLLAWIVRLVGACGAAFLVVTVVGVVSVSSPPASVKRWDQSAGAWAKIPGAEPDAISRDLGGERSQFAVTRAGDLLVAGGSGVSATFGRYGAVVSSSSGASLQLGLEAVGRGRSLVKTGPATPVGRSNTITYHRSGIDEWYANGPQGLEQGFTVHRRPGGTGELALVVGRVGVGTHVAVRARGTDLTLTAAHGVRSSLSYSNLKVTDADGHAVPATIVIVRRHLLLDVRDTNARYPLRIDPVIASTGAALTDDAGGFYGNVAASGDGATVVAGAPGSGQGVVDVFSEPATGGWQDATADATLTASNGAAGDNFGHSVAVSEDGSTIVVGAPGVASSRGAVYVFTKQLSGSWGQAAEITASDGTAGAQFGLSVAVSEDGSMIVVGAPEVNESAPGAAYVFSEPNGGWTTGTETAKLTASNGQVGEDFGFSVAMSGDGSTVVVGGPALNLSPVTGTYVFSEPPGGWQPATETAELPPDQGQSALGEAVAISNDGGTIVSGAGDPGIADVFTKPLTAGWQSAAEAAELPASDGAIADDLNSAIAVSENGGSIIVGVTSGAATGAGGADVFTEPTTGGWTDEAPTAELGGASIPMDGAGGFTTGVAITGNGSTAFVGSSCCWDPGGPVMVFPAAPVASSGPTISGNPVQGQTLTEVHGTWSNYPSHYAYQWEDCNTTGAACAPIPGATGQSYTLTNAEAGHTVVVKEAAANAGGYGTPKGSAPTAVVTALPPASSSAPTISGTAAQGDTLTAAAGSWTNSPTSFSYQWQDCDATGANCKPVPGATGQTYALVTGDIGYRVRVEVSASNSAGSSLPTASAPTSSVPESGPVGLVIDSGDYATNDPNVTIQAVWPVGTQSILISNNGGFRTNTRTVSPTASISWTLPRTGSDRLPKTVYVRFLGVGQDDINFTDDIILDETAPTIQSATVTGTRSAQASAARAPKRKIYKLHLKAKDQMVGVCEAATNQSRSSKHEVLTPLTSCKARGILKMSRTLQLKLQTRPRYARVRNSAGDWSRWVAVKS